MTTIAGISMSVDGFVTGPDDRPGQGLGAGGERLHYWVFGGPWTYEGEHDFGAMSGEDKAFYVGMTARIGSGIVGRGMYDAAGAWGGKNPFPGTLVVLTHRTGDPHDETSSSSTTSERRCGWPGRRPGTRLWASAVVPT